MIVHSLDSGDGDSPGNPDLVVSDPDSMHPGCHGEDAVSDEKPRSEWHEEVRTVVAAHADCLAVVCDLHI